ncbi:MAG TPA: hypothetical protein VMC43_03360, partial [Candidatus Paceibacterota bacterium]|nr:hypothetical protein [Candidatus Paceibacterota bacterium]
GMTSLTWIGLLTLAAFLLALLIVMFVLSLWYLPLWQYLQEGRFQAETKSFRRTGQPARFPRYLEGPIGAVFEKEALTLRRTPRSALWLSFMAFLWLTQTLLNFFIRANLIRHNADPAMAAHILEALHVLTAVYFMSAMSLRFVFPSFSTERRTSWLLGSAPLDLAQVYAAKFSFYCALFALIGGLMVGVNTLILDLALLDIGLFVTVMALSILFVTSFALALGAWFPSFETDDPEQLATSMPGLSFTALSLLYGAGGAYALYDVLSTGNYLLFGGFVAVSLVGLVMFLKLPPKTLARLEFGVGE